MLFANRAQAGRRLAEALDHLRGEDLVVLGLPRGGVPVAREVAEALGAPLDVVVVRKLGVPFQPELAMGAIGEGEVRVLNDRVVRMARITPQELAGVEARERVELERRARHFRGNRPPTPLEGRTAVVVDDGIATGATARAACQVVRALGARQVVLAVPVAPPGWEARIDGDADELVTVATPSPFSGIGQFYVDFSPTSDDEVVRCLRDQPRPDAERGGPGDGGGSMPADGEVAVGPLRLPGRLTLPDEARGLVVFAHGSGSSRHSPRNRYVAAVLNRARLGTLLFDLLSREEELDRGNVFDVDLLGRRLFEATAWARGSVGAQLPIGYFGASTGAAAALWAAAEPGADVAAVVSRGGRPDLAGPRLAAARAPTLLVVGGTDHTVLELNRRALAQLRCPRDLVVVPGAGHLFEEPGTLATAAGLARDWFVGHFASSRAAA